MKDLKHYFSSPKETSKSDLSSASIESLEWCAESRSLNGEGNLKMTLTLKGKKKKKRKPSSAMSDCSSEVAHVVPSSPDTDCKPAKKKRRISYDSLSVLNHKTKIQETDESINNVSIIEDMSSNSLQVDKKRKKRKTESAKSTFTNGTAVQKKKDIPVPRNELEEDVPSINGKRLTQDLNFDLSSICSSGPVVVECSREEPGDNLSKKRLKKGKKSKKKYKVEEDGTGSSGKENCTSNQSPRLDSSLEIGKLTPGIGEAKNKIMNYFNKVDKLVEIPQQRVCVLKVEAIVHSPPTGRAKVGKANPKRKVKMKRRDISAELDLITSEEDSLLENSPTSGAQSGKSWQMRVQLSKPTESETEDSLLSIPSIAGTNDVEECQVPAKKKIPSDDEDVEIVSIEKTPQNLLPKPARPSRGSGTLTSFFAVKPSAKSSMNLLNEEQLTAKQQFLESGVPENMKKLIKTKTCEYPLGQPAPYPKFSHTRQKDIMNIVWNLPKIRLNHDPVEIDSSDLLQFKWSIHIQTEQDVSQRSNYNRASFNTIENIKKTIKQHKQEANGFPISVWYKQLKDMKKHNEGEMWSEKFKPTLVEHFIANTKNIEKFKGWLEKYTNNFKTGYDDSSGNEFDDSDDETKKVQNIALLVGPNGSGKTSVVYAVASLLGYQVLELNASCNRTGKRLLLEFSEATQSHKLKVSSNFFNKTKKKKKENVRTLLLLEDADLVFQDFDEGFLSAVNSLISSTKRPLVLIANDANCKHLAKFMPHCQLNLKFCVPETKKLGSWLRTLILTEGIDISAFELTQLAEVCKGDVRQALLQLQFCSSSNMSSKQLLLRERTDLRSIWERVGEYDMRKKKELMKLRRVLKSLSAADTISQKISLLDKSVWPSYLDGCLKDSTCIEENFLPPHDLLGVAIVEELQTIVGSMTPPAGNENTLISSAAATKRAQTNFELEKGIGCVSVLSRRSLATDYFSAIREMAVSENYRLANQTKRNNRYFNHLQSSGFNLTEGVLDELLSTFADSRTPLGSIPSQVLGGS